MNQLQMNLLSYYLTTNEQCFYEITILKCPISILIFIFIFFLFYIFNACQLYCPVASSLPVCRSASSLSFQHGPPDPVKCTGLFHTFVSNSPTCGFILYYPQHYFCPPFFQIKHYYLPHPSTISLAAPCPMHGGESKTHAH